MDRWIRDSKGEIHATARQLSTNNVKPQQREAGSAAGDLGTCSMCNRDTTMIFNFYKHGIPVFSAESSKMMHTNANFVELVEYYIPYIYYIW